MKIAVWHNLPSGGGKRALYDHVKGLVKRGHTVEAWCPPTADQTYLPLSDLVAEHIIDLNTVRRTRVQTLQRRLSGGLVVADQIEAMQEHCRRCASQIASGDFDILFANSCQFFSSPFIGRWSTLPKALYLQEPRRYLYEADPMLPWLAPTVRQGQGTAHSLRELYRDLRKTQNFRVQAREEWLNAKAFDAVLVNSRFSRESIRRSYGLDARVCYLGVDTSLFQCLPQPKEDIVVGIGAFERHKNISFVLDALALIAEPRPRLVWIGNSRSLSYLEQLAAQAKSQNIEFEPKLRVTDKELQALLCRAAAMAYAPVLEPFGYAPLEANACGLPVVAVAEGGVRETVIDGINGLLVDADPQQMARAIERLRQDRGWAECLGKKARHHVEANWNVDSGIERLEQELKRVLETHHGS